MNFEQGFFPPILLNLENTVFNKAKFKELKT